MGFLNTNTVIMWQLMRTVRTLKAELRQILQGSTSRGAKEDESSTGRVWDLGCWISPCYGLFSLGRHFETYETFIYLIFKFFSGHSELQITEAAYTVSADMGA
jgi:hypothetical protein